MTILDDRYELVETVGEGGMGVVWRAHDTRLDRDVAVKLLRPYLAAEPDQRRRFAREARTLAALSHDHIVRVYDYVETGREAFLVMEFLDGANLADATFHRLPVPWSEAAAYALPVCEALAYAHAKGVVHRDLTPANILIERETGRVVTTDFGLARAARGGGSITTVGVLVGTPEYWSPEQALGRDSDGAADMYALGCVLYLLVSGRLPFEGDDRLAIGLRRAHEDVPSLNGTVRRAPEAAALVDSLLRRDPALRPDARTAARLLAESAEGSLPRLAARTRSPEAPTVALAGERRTRVMAEAAPTVVLSGARANVVGSEAAPTIRVATRRRRRRTRFVSVLAAAAAVGAIAGAVYADRLRDRVAHGPEAAWVRHGVRDGVDRARSFEAYVEGLVGRDHPRKAVRAEAASRWRTVFADSGSDSYASAPFTVSRSWRIRYRLEGGDRFLGSLTRFAWARDGDLFSYDGFVSDTAGALRVHDVSAGAGTFRISVSPYSADTSWYVEVDQLE